MSADGWICATSVGLDTGEQPMGDAMTFLSKNSTYFLLSAAILVASACGDGGCSACAGCGLEPIPGGFPIDDRIENSAQVRLSESGLNFIEDNFQELIEAFLEGGLEFDVPRTEFDGVPLYDRGVLCRNGNCRIRIEIRDVRLTPVEPNRLNLELDVVIDSRDSAGVRAPLPIRVEDNFLPDVSCTLDVDTRPGNRETIGFGGDIALVSETRAARAGYTKLELMNFDLLNGQSLEDNDIRVGGCSVLDTILNLLRGTIIGLVEDQVSGLVDGLLGDFLCTTRGETGCPTGTFEENADPGATCFYDTEQTECVPTLLGLDAQGDLGAAFLGGISPGATSPGQLVLASGGDGEAVNNGLSLFFWGGFRGTDRSFQVSPAHNPCVPLIEPPPLPTIPRSDVLRANTVPGGGPEAHVGIGISEMYLNYLGYGFFDSGLLCLGVGTRLSQQIESGLFSLLIGSLGDLSFPISQAPISLALRPQLPPVFEVGAGTMEDPVLTVTLPELEVDLYIWSNERYVRFMTYKADLAIPINLRVENGEIALDIVEISAANGTATNTDLLTEDPASLADIVTSVINGFASQFTSAIDPIALPDLMGIQLLVPEGGIVGFEDVGEEFLGIFANLGISATAMALSAPIETHASLESLEIDREALQLETFGQGEIPAARIRADVEGPLEVSYEYSYRVDGKSWSNWFTDADFVIQDPAFLFQARHEVEVRSRIAGEPASVDESPAPIEVLIDVLEPTVELERTATGVAIRAFDMLTDRADLTFRWRHEGEGEFSEWAPLYEVNEAGELERNVALEFDDQAIEVEVRDEVGNVGRAQSALIRGLPNPNAAGGCDCHVGDTGDSSSTIALVLLVVGGFLFRRRRSTRKSSGSKDEEGGPGGGARLGKAAKYLIVLLAFSVGACDCSDDPDMPGTACGDACTAATPPMNTGSICCDSAMMCVDYDLTALCDPGFICSGPDAVAIDGACAVTCTDCQRPPGLPEGHLVTYLDLVTDGSTTVVAGYSPGNPPTQQYGDLVIGQYDIGGQTADWEIVDGAPDMPVTNAPDGWRNGVSAPGDDVGRWASVAEAGGTYYVAYYDVTNGALKIAIGTPGEWAVHSIDDSGDAGRYASIAIGASGAPAIAYMRIQAAPDGSGAIESSVVVAQADNATPGAAGDWAATTIATAVMPCRPQFCADGTQCTEAGTCATDTGDCGGSCDADQVCVMTACQTTLPDPYIEDERVLKNRACQSHLSTRIVALSASLTLCP
ncbi:MAG: MYXO-CTERM sorting domain-containing protein [Myxococcota bacterium]